MLVRVFQSTPSLPCCGFKTGTSCFIMREPGIVGKHALFLNEVHMYVQTRACTHQHGVCGRNLRPLDSSSRLWAQCSQFHLMQAMRREALRQSQPRSAFRCRTACDRLHAECHMCVEMLMAPRMQQPGFGTKSCKDAPTTRQTGDPNGEVKVGNDTRPAWFQSCVFAGPCLGCDSPRKMAHQFRTPKSERVPECQALEMVAKRSGWELVNKSGHILWVVPGTQRGCAWKASTACGFLFSF